MSRPLRATQHCRHYSYERGLGGGPRCAKQVDLTKPGSFRMCMPDADVPCARREEYTEEERAAWKNHQAEGLLRMVLAVEAIPEPVPCGGRGQCKCPNCEAGELNWSRASNGHVWLQCSTPECLGPLHFNIHRSTVWPASKKA